MTGAFIPTGGDAVLAKEDAVIKKGRLILSKPVRKGRHLRRKGEELQKGTTVLKKGSTLQPGTIGFLAMLGKDKIKVYQRPRVTVIATGSELVRPGKKLKYGQIYESNSLMIQAALQSMNMPAAKVEAVKDNPKQLRKVIGKALRKSDVVILMGGVSVGDYDYVKVVLQEYDVRQLFWKVRQKPGRFFSSELTARISPHESGHQM